MHSENQYFEQAVRWERDPLGSEGLPKHAGYVLGKLVVLPLLVGNKTKPRHKLKIDHVVMFAFRALKKILLFSFDISSDVCRCITQLLFFHSYQQNILESKQGPQASRRKRSKLINGSKLKFK